MSDNGENGGAAKLSGDEQHLELVPDARASHVERAPPAEPASEGVDPAYDLAHAGIMNETVTAGVQQTLEHLSESVDLFDVPLFDYGDVG